MWPFKSQHSKTQGKIDKASQALEKKAEAMRRSENKKDEALDALNALLAETLKRAEVSKNNG